MSMSNLRIAGNLFVTGFAEDEILSRFNEDFACDALASATFIGAENAQRLQKCGNPEIARDSYLLAPYTSTADASVLPTGTVGVDVS